MFKEPTHTRTYTHTTQNNNNFSQCKRFQFKNFVLISYFTFRIVYPNVLVTNLYKIIINVSQIP